MWLGGLGLGESPSEREAAVAASVEALPPSLVRLAACGGGPLEMLRLIQGGVDVIDSDYPKVLTHFGYVASFALLPEDPVVVAGSSSEPVGTCLSPLLWVLLLLCQWVVCESFPSWSPHVLLPRPLSPCLCVCMCVCVCVASLWGTCGSFLCTRVCRGCICILLNVCGEGAAVCECVCMRRGCTC